MLTQAVLTTKLYAPPIPAGTVRRPRLLSRMREGARGRLTLLSAPAGFGKTTLASAWIADAGVPAAWLSLDEADGDAAGFVAYLVAALREAVGGVGEAAMAALQAPRPPPLQVVASELVNELATLPDGLTLVLDDYHTVDAPDVDEMLAFLVERLPPRVHLIVATREDPDLPLPRLRARGQLTELRATELRFTPDEAAAFLNDAMGLELTGDEVAALEARTEGWIAGLQLAALSLRDRDDVAGFVRAFAGDHRYVVDYLVDEVLRRQPEALRTFLLETSVLASLSAPLCEAVTGRARCDRLLASLERGNLFLVPLDDRRRWFRYHHLFAEMLRAHLDAERPGRSAVLLARASAWFENEGDPAEAVRYALAAGDHERAARLALRFGRAMRGAYRAATVLAWLDALPEAAISSRPLLSIEYARAATDLGRLDEAERRIRDAEAWLRDAKRREETVDEDWDAGHAATADQRPLRAAIATARAFVAQSRDDLDGTVVHARRALEALPQEDAFERGAVGCVQGLAQWSRGQLDAGFDAFRAGIDTMTRAGATLGLGPIEVLADMRLAHGKLNEAQRICRDALAPLREAADAAPMGAANLLLVLSEVAYEHGDLAEATRLLERSASLGEHAVQVDTEFRWHLARARRARDAGDLAGALRELDEAERRFHPTPIPDVRPIAALRAGVRLALGDLDAAAAWADARELTPDEPPTYLREFEQLTLARILIARGRHDRDAAALATALTLLGRLSELADRQSRTASATEILVVTALAHAARGDLDAAAGALERALRLAEPERRRRLFTAEGEPIERLLREAAGRRSLPAFAGAVAAAFRTRSRSGRAPSSEVDAAGLAAAPEQPLLEPLTVRELEVLRLIAEGLSNREIAERLYRALPTVKGYNREIFAKLQVQRRTEAIARARELGLL